MKKVLKRVLLVAVMISALIANGSNVTASVNENSKTFNLKIENSDGELNISIIDTEGVILHTEKYEGMNYSKSFDFKTLPNGRYYFEVEGVTKVNMIPVEVSSKGVKIIETTEKVYFKPIIRKKDDKIFISKLNLTNEVLKVSLYDENKNIIYKGEMKGGLYLSKTLNIKNIKSGDYFLVLKSSDKRFTESFTK